MRGAREAEPTTTVETLLASARAEIDRLPPREAMEAAAGGAVLVDIRPSEQRRREGDVPGAHIVDRNVLEWRLDPRSRYRDPDLTRPGSRVILICREGYQSSLAAATLRRFGVDAADVIGGTIEWSLAGLPLIPAYDEAAKESNLPSGGLHRPAGFEGQMGHQTPAAPRKRELGTS